MRRTLSLSSSGTAAAAAIAVAASYAPFVNVRAVSGETSADVVEATTGQDTAGVIDGAGGTESQLPDIGAGRPSLPRRLSRGAPLRRLFDLLSQLDCFWLAQDLYTGDTQRLQSSVRVLATVALLPARALAGCCPKLCRKGAFSATRHRMAFVDHRDISNNCHESNTASTFVYT
ncbi:hypothetical protein MRX96_035657 [Rhipicephalus microplus]